MRENEDLAKNDILLQKQGAAISRLIRQSGLSIVDIAKRLNVERATIYNWQSGKVAIPEVKLLEMAELFNREPSEIRYDILLFNQNDLIFVICAFEDELIHANIAITSKNKAIAIGSLYSQYQTIKLKCGDDLAKELFWDQLKNFTKLLTVA